MTPSKLASELEARIAKDEKWGHSKSLWSQIFVWTSIVASIAAAVVAATAEFYGKNVLLVLLSALAALSATVDKTVKFERKAAWHYCLATKLKGLLRALRHEGADPKEISKKFTEITESFEGEWPIGTDLSSAKSSNQTSTSGDLSVSSSKA